MSLCVLGGAAVVRIAAASFTLGWTHSVERIRWEEDWRVTPAGLELAEARVKGTGAGMEPPPEARLVGGWWVWRPVRPALDRLELAASGATGSGWTLCAAGRCREIGAEEGEGLTVEPCP